MQKPLLAAAADAVAGDAGVGPAAVGKARPWGSRRAGNRRGKYLEAGGAEQTTVASFAHNLLMQRRDVGGDEVAPEGCGGCEAF